MDKIILMGYMGSGKSVVAALLAKRMNRQYIDLDQYIESRTNLSIKNLFGMKGEVYFRKIEHQLLTEIINSEEKIVLSLGGGTPCYSNNHQLLTTTGVTSFYLKAAIAELAARLAYAKKDRPLISNLDGDELMEFIAKHLFERSHYYNQATHTIVLDGKSANVIVSEICALLV